MVVARIVQGAGAGAIVPLATAGASHLYAGHARSRAIGFVGAATFLGMALGPLLGSLVLEGLELRDAAGRHGHLGRPAVDAADARVALGLLHLGAARAPRRWSTSGRPSPGWDVPRARRSMDARGAVLATVALVGLLLAVTLIGDETGTSLPIAHRGRHLAIVCGALAVRRMLRVPEPFLDLRLFRDRGFLGAVLVSLLTGYALATAIIGVATFVDRVRFAGPDEQGIVLGADGPRHGCWAPLAAGLRGAAAERHGGDARWASSPASSGSSSSRRCASIPSWRCPSPPWRCWASGSG